MTTFHQLPPAVFDQLASGTGTPDGTRLLRATQTSKHLILVGHVLSAWRGDRRDATVDVLDRAKASDPEAYHRVLGAPLVGGWTAITTRALAHGKATDADLAYLSAIALVAARACGIPASLDLPVHDGHAVLPGLGAVRCSGTDLRVTVADGRLDVGPDDPRWVPLRSLAGDAAGQRIQVTLDDLDPYRHGHHAPPARRLPESEVDSWRELFADAWHLLATCRPGRAAELAVGLGALVPLAQTDERTARSATIRHAFGVFGLTRPPSAAEFAVTMVHEFQHSKLSAMLDLEAFTDPDDTGRYFAPWRTDPRPVAGLLQGVYAFVGVADTWRALRDATPVAEARFAEARLQVDHGLTALAASRALTPAGEALVSRLREVADDMLAERLSPAVAQAAELALAGTREAWLSRNGTAR